MTLAHGSRPLPTILSLTGIYAGCLLLTWLAFGFGQALLTGHRFFDDDVGAAMAGVLIPITTGCAALGFAAMAMWVLRPTSPPLGLRLGLITAAAGPVTIPLLWITVAAVFAPLGLVRAAIAGSGPAFAWLVGVASVIAGGLAMWLVHRIA